MSNIVLLVSTYYNRVYFHAFLLVQTKGLDSKEIWDQQEEYERYM